MASHGRTGLSRTWIGSVAHGVIRKSGVPVLLVRPAEHEPAGTSPAIRRILITTDGSALSEEILPAAMELARCEGASVTAVRVVEPVMWMPPITSMPLAFSPGAYDEDITSNLVAAAGREMQVIAQSLKKVVNEVETRVIVAESAARAILEVAESDHADLIAIATHGRGASRLLLGSVADKVLRGSDAMMLLQCPSARRLNGLTHYETDTLEVRPA
jgi:nucleotide-binding universal stress UspA family protein